MGPSQTSEAQLNKTQQTPLESKVTRARPSHMTDLRHGLRVQFQLVTSCFKLMTSSRLLTTTITTWKHCLLRDNRRTDTLCDVSLCLLVDKHGSSSDLEPWFQTLLWPPCWLQNLHSVPGTWNAETDFNLHLYLQSPANENSRISSLICVHNVRPGGAGQTLMKLNREASALKLRTDVLMGAKHPASQK